MTTNLVAERAVPALAEADSPPAGLVEPRKTPPVKWWAGVGAAFIALEIYVIAAWLLSGDATPTPDGSTPIPDWQIVSARVIEIGGVLGAGAMLWFFLVRPWRRAGHITADGLLLLAVILVYWQDPLLNYTQTWTTISTAFVNVGNWTGNVPGVVSPTAHLFAEAPLWAGMAYVYAVFGAIVLSNVFMRRVQRRRPQISRAGLILVCFAFIATFDFIFEVAFMRVGLFSYAGAIEELTLFHGHYYQFPVYETIFFGGMWTGLACLRYFRNDKGETFAERGAGEVTTSPRRKTVLRLLAICGAVNVIYLVGFNVPIQVFAMHADPWPQDILNRSYLTNGVCGPDTDRACPGPAVPIPRGNSAYLDPSGRLVPAR